MRWNYFSKLCLRDRKRQRGVILLEVIVALAIFAVASVSALVLVRQSSTTVKHIRDTDERTRAASAFLETVSLWPREDLDRRLGHRRQGPWMLYIDRPTPILYRIVLSDSTGQYAILETTLFRAELASNAR